MNQSEFTEKNLRSHHFFDFLLGELARSATPGAIGDAIDTALVEARNPQLKAPLGDSRVAASQLEICSAQQQMNGIEPALCLLVGTAIDRRFQFFQGTAFGIGKLALPTDARNLNSYKLRTS